MAERVDVDISAHNIITIGLISVFFSWALMGIVSAFRGFPKPE